MVMITSLPTTRGNSVYPTMRTLFTFTVNPATCDCTLLNWDIPAKITLNVKLTKTPTTQLAMATVNEASKTAVPAIRSCVGSFVCDMTSTIVLVEKNQSALPTFITFNNDVSSRILSLAPTVSSQMTTTNPAKPKYTLTMTQTTRNGDGNLVWDAIDVTVSCEIERIDVPTKPADITYNILGAAIPVSLTPPFTQFPPCDYAINHALTW